MAEYLGQVAVVVEKEMEGNNDSNYVTQGY